MPDAAFCGCVLPALGCKKLCVYPSSLSVLAGSIARSRSPGCDILCALPPAAQTHAKAIAVATRLCVRELNSVFELTCVTWCSVRCTATVLLVACVQSADGFASGVLLSQCPIKSRAATRAELTVAAAALAPAHLSAWQPALQPSRLSSPLSLAGKLSLPALAQRCTRSCIGGRLLTHASTLSPRSASGDSTPGCLVRREDGARGAAHDAADPFC